MAAEAEASREARAKVLQYNYLNYFVFKDIVRCLSEFKWVSCLIRLDQLWTAFAGVSTMEKALNEVAVL